MNIAVLLGSPNRQGSSRILAESFRQGAEEAGRTVEMIDVAHGNIHPCSGCIHCGYEGLRFIPVSPALESSTVLAWKKTETFPPAVTALPKHVKNALHLFVIIQNKH